MSGVGTPRPAQYTRSSVSVVTFTKTPPEGVMPTVIERVSALEWSGSGRSRNQQVTYGWICSGGVR